MERHFDLAPDEWATLRRLLDEALDLPAGKRDAWLERLRGDDAGFEPRLRTLLAHAEGTAVERLLQTLPKVETGAFAGKPDAEGDAAAEPGQHVGPYRLLREIGEGGMASVWLAERSDVLQRRQVALKLPHGTWRRAAWAARLAREREILATLEHPNIARLYDAGVAADGQPYLALEYVEGQRIDVHCRERGLDVRQRLSLFMQVAHAVAHAHARLVVHRDLKPSNILVTAEGQVRLLDFGIAKLLEQGLTQETELTLETGRALTPDYAAPEQIRGEPIGTSADIYSLGVVLFELLTGERPYKLKRDSRAALEEAILKAEPPRPSDTVSDPKLHKQLRGDLDTIVLKALKKAPAERYATVDALAADVERWLNHWPVLARPDSRWYRVRKFVVRNKLGATAGTVALLAIVASAGLALWQASAALAQKQRADEVKEFVASVFEGVDPTLFGTARAVTAVDVLEQAQRRIDKELRADPVTRAELATVVGRSYIGLHEFERAIQAMEPMLDGARSGLPAGHPALVDLMLQLAGAYTAAGRIDDAKRVLARANTPPISRESAAYASWKLGQASLAHHQGHWKQAVELAREALQAAEQGGEARRDISAEASHILAGSYSMERNKEQGLLYAERAYRERLALYGGDLEHPKVVQSAQDYAASLIDRGRFAEASVYLRQAIAGAKKVYGPNTPLLIEYSARLGVVELEQGAIKSALEHLREADRAATHRPVADTLACVGQLRTLGRALIRSRDFVEAAAALERAERVMALFKNESILRVVQADRAFADAFGRDPNVAIAMLERIVIAQNRDDPRYKTHLPEHYLGVLLRLMGRPADADRHLMAVEKVARANTRKSELADTLIEMGLTRLDLGNAESARAVLEEAKALLSASQKFMTPAAADVEMALGRIKLSEGKHADAEPHLSKADAFWREFDPDNRSAGEAAHWLARCYAALGRHGEWKSVSERAATILAHSQFPADAALVAQAHRR